MNHLTLLGRIRGEPKFQYSDDGLASLVFTVSMKPLSSSRSQVVALFASGELAEQLVLKVNEGDRACVLAHLIPWEDDQGVDRANIQALDYWKLPGDRKGPDGGPDED